MKNLSIKVASVVLGLSFLVAGSAHAEIYTAVRSWNGGTCYSNGPAPEWDLANVDKLAERTACKAAKDACYTRHSHAHPHDNFDCEVKESYLLDWNNNVWSTADGYHCDYTSEAMSYAQAKCIVEVVRQ